MVIDETYIYVHTVDRGGHCLRADVGYYNVTEMRWDDLDKVGIIIKMGCISYSEHVVSEFARMRELNYTLPRIEVKSTLD